MACWTSVIRNPRRFAALPAHDRWLLLRAALLLPLVTVGRRVMSFKRLHGLVARLMPLKQPVAADSDLVAARRMARLVQIAAGHGLVSVTCLDRSLVLWGLLRRQGMSADLRLGARKDGDSFAAHAWVEYQGAALNDTHDVRDRYAVFEQQAEHPSS